MMKWQQWYVSKLWRGQKTEIKINKSSYHSHAQEYCGKWILRFWVVKVCLRTLQNALDFKLYPSHYWHLKSHVFPFLNALQRPTKLRLSPPSGKLQSETWKAHHIILLIWVDSWSYTLLQLFIEKMILLRSKQLYIP
jgi:hypothetical protein